MSNTIGYKSRIITQKVKAAAPLVTIAAASPRAVTGSLVEGTDDFFKALMGFLEENIWYMDVLDGDVSSESDNNSMLQNSAPILRSGSPERLSDYAISFKFNLISGSLARDEAKKGNVYLALKIQTTVTGENSETKKIPGVVWFTVDTGSNVLKLDTGESQIITWELSFQSGTNVSSSTNS